MRRIIPLILLCALSGSGFAMESLGNPLASVDIAKFDKIIFADTVPEILKEVGPPAARYMKDGDEYWLYDNAFKEADGKRKCPELLVKKGRCSQINWHPEAIMKKAVTVAKGFADWKPPTEVKEKSFTVDESFVIGQSKAEVTGKLGEPDVKCVFNGIEVWEYHKVPMAKDKPEKLVIYLEFQDDKVSKANGN